MDESSSGHPRGRCFTGFTTVVAWVPEPLGTFLNELRAPLAPALSLPAHLTLAAPGAFTPALDERIGQLSGFDVLLGEVEVFEASGVVSLAVAAGRRHLEDARALLEAAPSPFPFQPHVSLAQGVARVELARVAEHIRRRWEDRPASGFRIESVAVVRNAGPFRWEMLGEHRLRPASLLRIA